MTGISRSGSGAPIASGWKKSLGFLKMLLAFRSVASPRSGAAGESIEVGAFPPASSLDSRRGERCPRRHPGVAAARAGGARDGRRAGARGSTRRSRSPAPPKRRRSRSATPRSRAPSRRAERPDLAREASEAASRAHGMNGGGHRAAPASPATSACSSSPAGPTGSVPASARSSAGRPFRVSRGTSAAGALRRPLSVIGPSAGIGWSSIALIGSTPRNELVRKTSSAASRSASESRLLATSKRHSRATSIAPARAMPGRISPLSGGVPGSRREPRRRSPGRPPARSRPDRTSSGTLAGPATASARVSIARSAHLCGAVAAVDDEGRQGGRERSRSGTRCWDRTPRPRPSPAGRRLAARA